MSAAPEIEFISDRERELFAEAHLGETARGFLLSDTGRYLHGRAQEELDKCKEEMLKLDPESQVFEASFRTIQARAWCADHFIKWCTDVISEGDAAYVALGEEENG
jgi:hypothetical protein